MNHSDSKVNSVDIAICTWNRQDLLQRTLRSVESLEVDDEIELTLLMVNNASTDDTGELIEAFKSSEFARRHRFVDLYESQQGHTYSRNCAVNASTADLILWTDDDVLLPPSWVSDYVEAARSQPDVAFWGSQIEPEFIGGRPDWIGQTWDIVQGCFATRDLGAEAIPFTAERLPYGANFGLRGSVQRDNLFATELGRRGDAVLGEDELDLMRRLLANGHQGKWIPNSTVKHLIPESRSTIEYIRGYFLGQGRALAAKGNPWHTDVAKLRKEASSESFAYQWKRFLWRPEVWVSHLVRSALAQGQAEFLESIDG